MKSKTVNITFDTAVQRFNLLPPEIRNSYDDKELFKEKLSKHIKDIDVLDGSEKARDYLKLRRALSTYTGIRSQQK